jgi:hypothetical protein
MDLSYRLEFRIAYGNARRDNNPPKRSIDKGKKTEHDWINDLFRLRLHTKDTISRTVRAYFFHEIEYDPVSQQRITSISESSL